MRQEGPSPPSGDGVDWQQVHREHGPRLRRLIAARVPAAAVEDVLQETFLRAFRGRHGLDTTRPLGPWLRTIAVRAAADGRRKAAAEARRHVPVDGRALADVAGTADVAEEYEAGTRRQAVREVLGSLAERHRELLETVVVEGHSQAAVARRRGLAPDAVRAATMRARRRFRVVYERLAQEHGLAGVGGSLKPALARLRARLRQVEALVPVHGDAWLGIAGLAVVAGVTAGWGTGAATTGAAAGAGRETAIEASVPRATAGVEVSGRDGVEVSVAVRVSPRTVDDAGAAVGVDGPPTLRYEPLGAEATVGKDGDGARLTLKVDGNAFGHDSRTYAGAEIYDCKTKPSSTALCTVIQAGEAVADAAGAS